MRIIPFLTAFFLQVLSLRAEYAIVFANVGPGVDAPVTNAAGQRITVPGPFVADLFYSTLTNTLPNPLGTDTLVAAGFNQPFTALGSGYFLGGAQPLTNVTVLAQVRVWDATYGTTYAQARDAGGQFGWSQTFLLTPTAPPATPAQMRDMVGFVLTTLSDDLLAIGQGGIRSPPTPSSSETTTADGELFGSFGPRSTCGLYLDATLSNTVVLLTVQNTTGGIAYQILGRTNVEQGSWTVETNFVGTTGQNFTSAAIPMLGRPRMFFVASDNHSYSMETNFAGVNAFEAGAEVADTMGAVGPNHFVELLNNRIAVFDKASGQRLEEANSALFFSLQDGGTNYPMATTMIDPRILFDHESQRWIACANDYFGSRHAILAITTNNSPLGLLTNWTKHLVPLAVAQGDSDFPTLGVDANGIYLTAVHRDSSSNVGQTIVAFKKPEIYQGTVFRTRMDLGTNVSETKVWTIQPAVNFDPVATNDYVWLVAKGPPQFGSNYQGGSLLYRRLQWSNTTAVLVDADWNRVESWPQANYRDYYDIDGTNLVTLPRFPTVEVPQAAGPVRISLVPTGSRLMNAMIRGGFLYTCQNVGLSATNATYVGNESGSNVTRSAVQWFKLQVEPEGTLTYYKHDRIHDPAATNPIGYYYPSIAVNCAGDILLGFSGSSASTYISAYYCWYPAAGPGGGQVVCFYGGEGYYYSNRWGDYSFTTVDPSDSTTFWTVQEHGTSAEAAWGTRVAKVKKTY